MTEMTIEKFEQMQREFIEKGEHTDIFENAGTENIIKPELRADAPVELFRFWLENYDKLAMVVFND